MAHRTAVINVVGLAAGLVGEHTPRLAGFAARGHVQPIRPVLPAVTCPVQASMLTGCEPASHGIVGNGWYDRDRAEVAFWEQSNRLVEAEKVWETARRRDPAVTCAVMFWWYNMHSTADWSVTPRPIYKADGRKIPDIHAEPEALRALLQDRLGRFPLFKFWGPGSSIESSRWIAEASRIVHERHDPTLLLVYLPHLDYGLQKLGPDDPQIVAELAAVDEVAGELIDWLERRDVRVIVLSEYGIVPVRGAVAVNRVLRERGHIRVREEEGLEALVPGDCAAFAVVDHQVAHVYVREPERVPEVAEVCRAIDGVEQVLGREQKEEAGLAHPRAGDLVLVAATDRWFTYDYWLDAGRAPDFARTVDIHRKPGYDPRELFLDPRKGMMGLRIGGKLLRKRLGFRTLLDVIPLDTSLVRGSHGRVEADGQYAPVIMSGARRLAQGEEGMPCTAVRDVILDHLFE